jgi:transcriptional regulator with XRE-family HTH domain
MAEGMGPWLRPGLTEDQQAALPRLGEVLREYRAAHHLTQAALADLLGVDQTYVSMIERGRRTIRDIGFLLRVSRVLEIAPADLGLSNELMITSLAGPGQDASAGWPVQLGEPVVRSQDEWRNVRRYLNHHRNELARLAASLYPPEFRVKGTPLIAAPSWLPAEPVDLTGIDLAWIPHAPPPRVTGTEPETQPVRPMRVPGQQYDRYTSAVRYLDPPSMFENRPSYRLLGLAWAGTTGAMRFGMATYFDKLDVSEAVGHELAQLHQRRDGKITLRDLPFRSLIGDPFDLQRRAVLPAITTLTLRRVRGRGSVSFLLHWRDPRKVATAAGLYDVIPAGEFQPSSIAPHDLANDFDIWRNIVREYSEELLGAPESDGSRSEPIDYQRWPFYRALGQARAEGKLHAVCLGAGLDSLTLAATILTVVLIDADVFDEVFRHAVQVNAEGVTVFGEQGNRTGHGLAFTEQNVTRLLEREPMASPGAACLALAWRHRVALLAR